MILESLLDVLGYIWPVVAVLAGWVVVLWEKRNKIRASR